MNYLANILFSHENVKFRTRPLQVDFCAVWSDDFNVVGNKSFQKRGTKEAVGSGNQNGSRRRL